MQKKTHLLYKKLTNLRFVRYILVGGIATGVDWSLFYILALTLNVYYLLSLILSFSAASITHYILNKIFTFKCKSKMVVKQFFYFISISIISLILSTLIILILVDLMLIQKMISRIITTLILFILNYFMHKYFTFNRRFFK
jgi:putative flippase GtrA